MQYIVSDYFATGEGRTISILITMAIPKQGDYETQSDFKEVDGKLIYVPGNIKHDNTPCVIAQREFTLLFGEYMAFGAECFDQGVFWEKYGMYVSEYVKDILLFDNGDITEYPPAFNYYTQIYVNFS